MLGLLRRLPVPVLVLLGAVLLAMFVAALAQGLTGRRAGFLGLACLVIAALALLRSRRGSPGRDRRGR